MTRTCGAARSNEISVRGIAAQVIKLSILLLLDNIIYTSYNKNKYIKFLKNKAKR